MKEEEKKKKKRKYWKAFFIAATTGIGIWAADKCIPGFNKNITKLVKGWANTVASDVKDYFLKDDQSVRQERQPREQEGNINSRPRENRQQEKKFTRESYPRNNNRDNRNNNRRQQKNF